MTPLRGGHVPGSTSQELDTAAHYVHGKARFMLGDSIRPLLVEITLATTLLLSACNADPEQRPSTDELAETMADDGLAGGASSEVVDCMAKAFHASDLSDEFLQALVEGDADYDANAEDTAAMTEVTQTAATECMGS